MQIGALPANWLNWLSRLRNVRSVCSLYFCIKWICRWMRGIILATSMSKNAAALWIIQKEKIRNALCLATIISLAIYVFVLIPRNNNKYFQQIREMSSLDSRMYLGFLYPRAFYEIERIEDGESKLKNGR